MTGDYSESRSNEQQYHYTTEPSPLLNNENHDDQYQHQQYYQQQHAQDIESHLPMYVFVCNKKKVLLKTHPFNFSPVFIVKARLIFLHHLVINLIL